MQFFRRLVGGGGGVNGYVAAPPSYENSEDVSLSAVLAGAARVVNAAFPDASGEKAIPVFRYIAETPCPAGGGRGSVGHPFLHRIREAASNTSGSIKLETRERVDRGAAALGVPVESLVLVATARVLRGYYETRGHRDRDGRTKTRLEQMAACEAKGCGCFDFDLKAEPPSSGTSEQKSGAGGGAPATTACCCGHGEGAHRSGRRGVEALAKWYTNWEPASYRSLGHRDPDARRKHYMGLIEKCQACGCPDYDKMKRSSSCECGHYDTRHKKPDPKVDRDLSWILVENAYLYFANTMVKETAVFRSLDGEVTLNSGTK